MDNLINTFQKLENSSSPTLKGETKMGRVGF